MKAWLRAQLVDARNRALWPVLIRLDAHDAAVQARLDALSRRIDEIERYVEAADGRASTMAERTVAQSETQTRLDRRIEEISRLLGSSGPAHQP